MTRHLARFALLVIFALVLFCSGLGVTDTIFDDAWIASRTKGDGFSYPADKPVKRIDHIFYRDRVRAKRAWVVETLASDHVPVVAELEIQ